MTDEEINEAVARKLGKKILAVYPNGDIAIDGQESWIPDYCHSIAAAWEVVEHLPPSFSLIRRDDRKFVCTFLGPNGIDGGGSHDTAPMAICLAFLKLP